MFSKRWLKENVGDYNIFYTDVVHLTERHFNRLSKRSGTNYVQCIIDGTECERFISVDFDYDNYALIFNVLVTSYGSFKRMDVINNILSHLRTNSYIIYGINYYEYTEGKLFGYLTDDELRSQRMG